MATHAPTRNEQLATRIIHVFFAILVCAALAYPADWLVWRIRMAWGAGLTDVPVSQVTAAELKGNKEEYYWDGNVTISCSRSLFPQSTYSPCWYLRRHMENVTRY